MEGQGSQAAAEGGRASLDIRTQLTSEGSWGMKAWPDAGEAVIYWRPVRSGGPADDEVSAWGSLSEAERAAAKHARATSRARSESRRYLVANRLRYMWVLTLAGAGLHGVDGRRHCMKLVGEFAERLRAEFGQQPYWYSPELHPGGHGWHVNFFVQRRLAHSAVTRMWGRGVVWVKDWVKDSRIRGHQLTLIQAIRLGAEYGCKYAAKDWSAEVLDGGAHRYEIAQGFQPVCRTSIVPRLASAFARVTAQFGRPADEIWSYDEAETWYGPPVWVLSWRFGARTPDDLRGSADE